MHAYEIDPRPYVGYTTIYEMRGYAYMWDYIRCTPIQITMGVGQQAQPKRQVLACER
jgi:hypothetical protein